MLKYYLYDFAGYNTYFFLLINKLTNYSILPFILYFLSGFFFFVMPPIYLSIYSLIIYISNKLKKPIVKFDDYFNFCYRSGLCFILFLIIYTFLKYSVNLERPFCSLDPELFSSIKTSFLEDRCNSSFPSAHSGLSLMILYFLWNYLSKIQKWVGILIVILVGVSRISIAMHYPSDVLYGYLIMIVNIKFARILEGKFPVALKNYIKYYTKIILKF